MENTENLSQTDYAIIEYTEVAENGEIVVALVNNEEVTLKILEKKNNAAIGLASYGAAALAIGVWIVIDVKHFVLKEYYKSNKVDLSLNNKGQVELQIAF